jgi:membrane protein implicated in regulation of membrane protease activity
MWWSSWWVWIAGGLLLGTLEVVLPGYVFVGFAIGAVLTGLLILAGLAGGSLPVLLLIFAVLSLVAWLALRRLLGVRAGQVKVWRRDINED